MITVGGENLIDFVQTGVDNELPVFTAVPGGSCYNVAITIARQNQPVSYVTPISTDSLGDLLAERLVTDGVILGTPRSDAPTSLAVVSISNGQPSYQFYRNKTAERRINTKILDAAIRNLTKIFHIGSLSLINGEDATCWERKFQALTRTGVITSLDPNARPVAIRDKTSYVDRFLRMAKFASVLKLSDEDLKYIIPDTTVEDAFDQLYEKAGAQLMILTKGSKGSLVRTPNGQFDAKAVVANPFRDTVGAGDTFMGTILVELYKLNLSVDDLCILSLEKIKVMVERASRAAALNCQTAGCNPPYGKI